jgi:hypothetical protein
VDVIDPLHVELQHERVDDLLAAAGVVVWLLLLSGAGGGTHVTHRIANHDSECLLSRYILIEEVGGNDNKAMSAAAFKLIRGKRDAVDRGVKLGFGGVSSYSDRYCHQFLCTYL